MDFWQIGLKAQDPAIPNLPLISPNPVRLKLSDNIATGGTTATTRQLNIPSGKASGDFEAGTIADDTNPLASFNPGSAKFSEWEICVEVIDALTNDNDEIEFRLTNVGTALSSYTVTPKWTIGTSGQSVVPILMHSYRSRRN
jgi:hypothetical protein